MKVNKQARVSARKHLRGCIFKGQLDEDRVRQVVQQIITSKPRDYLSILAYFQHLLKLELDRRTAQVESVYPLEESVRVQVRSRLSQRHGPGLRFIFKETPSLIGGLRIKVGSDVYDGSIRSRLSLLQSQF